MAPLVWWLVGDLTSPGFRPDELDYVFRAPESWDINARTAGIIGAAIIAVALGFVARLSISGRLARPDWVWIAIAGGVGAYLGLAGRVFTAGGIGANIGAGLMLMAGLAGCAAAIAAVRRSDSAAFPTSTEPGTRD